MKNWSTMGGATGHGLVGGFVTEFYRVLTVGLVDRCAVELYGQLVVARGRPERCVDARLESAVVAIATDDPQGQVTSRSSFHIFFYRVLPSFLPHVVSRIDSWSLWWCKFYRVFTEFSDSTRSTSDLDSR